MPLRGRTIERMLRLPRSSRGGAAVELAVVFPVLLLLIVGAIDYGRMYFTSVTVANAARAGAEYGAQDVATSQKIAAIQNFALLDGADAGNTLRIAARTYCECAKASHACTACTGGAAPDIFVEVIATDTISTLLPYPGLPTRVPIVRKATFRSQ